MDQNLLQFANQNYLNLETFRKAGKSIQTPVWFVQDGAKIYVRTGGTSGKVKRIRNNSQVNIMPCGQVGEPLGDWIPATAREMTDADTAVLVRKLLVEKYADMVARFEAQAKADGLEYTAILIEVS
ncbi:MAG: PPOX class F420-dependent oxidoreductase [Chloroflexi bacterium]|nr:PPOX class F420-dependent oxidoreductase [Chloroflexota bacterium]